VPPSWNGQAASRSKPLRRSANRVYPATGHAMIHMAARPTRGTGIFIANRDEIA
jgi:hypothetical protein